jgi:Glycine cleavage T-protein C-terminal barrel domain
LPAVLATRERAPPRRLVTLVVDALDADAMGDEPVWPESKVVGWVTSGGFGHCVNRSIALAYIPASLAEHTDGFEVEILGECRPAQRVAQALYDPSGTECALPDDAQATETGRNAGPASDCANENARESRAFQRAFAALHFYFLMTNALFF